MRTRSDGTDCRCFSQAALVLHRVLDQSHPPAAVIAQQPPRLKAGTPPAIVLDHDLDLSWWVVPAFLE
jgi:hypothetical protein